MKPNRSVKDCSEIPSILTTWRLSLVWSLSWMHLLILTISIVDISPHVRRRPNSMTWGSFQIPVLREGIEKTGFFLRIFKLSMRVRTTPLSWTAVLIRYTVYLPLKKTIFCSETVFEKKCSACTRIRPWNGKENQPGSIEREIFILHKNLCRKVSDFWDWKAEHKSGNTTNRERIKVTERNKRKRGGKSERGREIGR